MSLVYKPPPSSSLSPHAALYLGGKAEAKSKELLDRLKITHILNVTPPKQAGVQSGVPNYFESKRNKNKGDRTIVYQRIPVFDAPSSDLLSYLSPILSFIDRGLCHGGVLVHCQRGVSRSPTVVALYLMRKCGISLSEAMAWMQRTRPTVHPIPAFVTQLEQYEAECQQKGYSSSAAAAAVVVSIVVPATSTADTNGEMICINTEESRKRTRPTEASMIGPMLPPNTSDVTKKTKPNRMDEMAVAAAIPAATTATTTTTTTTTTTIGPQLLPSPALSTIDKEESDKGMISATLIGPQLPSG